MGLRAALWWGFALALILILSVNLVVPMNSLIARLLLGLLILLGVFGLLTTRWRGRLHSIPWIPLIVSIAVLVVLGVAALGPVVNYDTGLYHLGAIGYAREFGTVPGLANVHDRFGFNSSLWPLGATADSLGMGLQGFRVINGFILTLLVVEVLGRLRSAPRTPGSILLFVTGTVALFGSLQYTDRLIAGPSQDFAALALFLVSSAYLLDALQAAQRGINPWRAAGLSILLASLAATVRPLGWLVVAVTAAVFIGVWVRHPKLRFARRGVFLWPVTLSVVLAILMSIRDVLLSGWFLFPLGLIPFPVDWRLPSTAATRADITGWARTPFQDPSVTLADNTWVLGWLQRLPLDWGFLAAAGLFFLGFGLSAALAWSRPELRKPLQAALPVFGAAATPSLAALVAWFVTAPDPRFAWGPLLVIAALPLVWWLDVARLRSAALVATAVLLAVIAVGFGWMRSEGFGLFTDKETSPAFFAVPVTPLPVMLTEAAVLVDGTPAQRTTGGDDRCWAAFPLCAPWYAPLDAERRGQDLRNGFRPAIAQSRDSAVDG